MRAGPAASGVADARWRHYKELGMGGIVTAFIVGLDLTQVCRPAQPIFTIRRQLVKYADET